MGKIHGKIAVDILAGIFLCQKFGTYTGILQLVLHFADFHQEVTPLSAVKREKAALLRFLRHGQIGLAVRIFPAIEVMEVGFGQVFALAFALITERFAHEYVLLVQRIPFAECLGNGGEQPGVFIVPVYVSGVFIHRVLHAQDSRILSVFGIYHADTLVVFHGEVNVLEDALALSSCAKGIYRYGHTRAYSRKNQ